MHCDNLRVLLVILVVFLVSDTVLCNSPVGDYFESVSGHQLEALLNDPGLLYSQNQLVYPLPDNRCSIQDRIRLSSCDVEARQDWNIRDTDYVSTFKLQHFYFFYLILFTYKVHRIAKVLLLRVGPTSLSAEYTAVL